MSNNVYWLLELNIKPGQMGNFKTLVDEMVSSTKEESGTLNYEWAHENLVGDGPAAKLDAIVEHGDDVPFDSADHGCNSN